MDEKHDLTLAEAVLLLALHDEKGTTGFRNVHPGLAGALLVDLGELGALRVEDGKLVGGDGRLAHPVLARAQEAIRADKPRSAKAWVTRLPGRLKPLIDTVAGPLVDRGVLERDRHKVLGLFGRTTLRARDSGPERALRARLGAVLADGAEPSAWDAQLIGLLAPLDLVNDVVERDQRRAARKRAKEIADGGIAGNAVSEVVRDVQTAVMAAVVVSAASAGSSGGS